MNERYKAVEGSKTAHCCFEATVVDTLASIDDFAWVWECFDMENAQKIADALNAADTATDGKQVAMRVAQITNPK